MTKHAYLMLVLVVSCLLAPGFSSAQSMPPEVKSFTLRFLNEMGAATTALSSTIDAAEQPGQIARALDTYTGRIEPLVHGLAALRSTHPAYFAAMDQKGEQASSGDPEVDRAQAQFDAQSDALEDRAMIKVIRHSGDPQVRTALLRMQQVMAGLNTGDDDDDDDDDDEW